MKKYFTKIFISPKLWFAAVLTLLVWAGCSNEFSPQALKAGKTGEESRNGRLHITVASGVIGARTLFPTPQPLVFTKYVLSFAGPAGATRADETIDDGTTSVTIDGLIAGNWAITARGYIDINGSDEAAAEGTKIVTIGYGDQNVTVDISAKMEGIDGSDGMFTYNVTWPADKVTWYYIDLYSITGNNHAYQNDNGQDSNGYPVETFTSGIPLSKNVAPGYYIMSVNLGNGDQGAGRSEVVHIYSGMETVFEYEFTNDDFATFITLGGTATVTINDIPVTGGWVDITRTDLAPGENDYAGRADLDYSNGWKMRIPIFNQPASLRFTYNVGGFLVTGIDREVYNTDVSDIDLFYNQNPGYAQTFNFTLNEYHPDYSDANNYYNAELEGDEYLPAGKSRIEKNDYYTLKYAFVSDKYVDQLSVYLVDDQGTWDVLSNYFGINNIEANTIVSGEIHLWVLESAGGTAAANNKIRFDTGNMGTETAPTLQFLQFDFELETGMSIIVPSNVYDDGDGQGSIHRGWQVSLPLHDHIPGDQIREGDVYTISFNLMSNIDFDGWDIGFMLVDDSGEWKSFAWGSVSGGEYITAGTMSGPYRITLTADGTSSSNISDANRLVISATVDVLTEPALTFYGFTVTKQ